MEKTFKKLNICHENIKTEIKCYFEVEGKKCDVILEKISDTCFKVIISQVIEQVLEFNYFLLKGGKVTISFAQYGMSDENIIKYLIPLKDWLVNRCSYSEANPFYSINLKLDDYETLMSFIEESSLSKKIISEDDIKKIIKLESKENKSYITMTYFKTQKLLIQGPATYCYWTVFTLLSKLELITLKEEEKIIFSGTTATENNPDELLYKDILTKLNDDCEMMLKSYIALKKAINDVILPDYSSLCFYPLRISESVLREQISRYLNSTDSLDVHSLSILKDSKDENKIPIFNENGKINSYISINDTYKKDTLESLYCIYKTNRHTLFHAKEYNSSRILERQEDARKICSECLRYIQDIFK